MHSSMGEMSKQKRRDEQGSEREREEEQEAASHWRTAFAAMTASPNSATASRTRDGVE